MYHSAQNFDAATRTLVESTSYTVAVIEFVKHDVKKALLIRIGSRNGS